MNKLFIHIGTHKTGSSAIQHALYEKTKLLKKENIIVFPFSRNYKKLSKKNEIDKELIEEMKKDSFKFISSNSDTNNYVLSFESFSGEAYKSYHNTKVIAKSLFEIFKNKFEIKIIVFIRRQDEFIESLYTQSIHEGSFESFNTFYNKLNIEGFNWFNFVDIYANIFGEKNIILHKYEKKYLNNYDGIVNCFFNTIGSKEIENKEKSKFINAGYSRDALEIARICNEDFSKLEKDKLRYLLQITNAKKSYDNYNFLSLKDRSKIIEKFEESNRTLFNKYIKTFKENDYFDFVLINDKYEEEYTGLNEKNIIKVIIKMIVEFHDKNELHHYSRYKNKLTLKQRFFDFFKL